MLEVLSQDLNTQTKIKIDLIGIQQLKKHIPLPRLNTHPHSHIYKQKLQSHFFIRLENQIITIYIYVSFNIIDICV